jgi:hypothetical protein
MKAEQQIKKPSMPEEKILFSGTGEAYLMADFERYSSGSMFMSIERATVNSGETVMGEVNLCLGCGVGVHINGRTWGIDPLTLYKIAKQADDAYLESVK